MLTGNWDKREYPRSQHISHRKENPLKEVNICQGSTRKYSPSKSNESSRGII